MNKGMGHKFLKHLERTRQLLFVVDISGFQLSSVTPYRTAFETIILLTKVSFLVHCVLDVVHQVGMPHSNESNHLCKDFLSVERLRLLFPVFSIHPSLQP